MKKPLLIAGMVVVAVAGAYLAWPRPTAPSPSIASPSRVVAVIPPPLPAVGVPPSTAPPTPDGGGGLVAAPADPGQPTLADVKILGDRLAQATTPEERERLRHEYVGAAARLDYQDQRTAFWRLEELDGRQPPDAGSPGTLAPGSPLPELPTKAPPRDHKY